jgi:hypothetical protein
MKDVSRRRKDSNYLIMDKDDECFPLGQYVDQIKQNIRII